jgi:uncharacterized protein (DUF362 family)
VTDHSTNPSTNQVLPGCFLDVESLCELLRTETVAVLTIPKGVKENMYFVVNNDKRTLQHGSAEKKAITKMIVEYGY